MANDLTARSDRAVARCRLIAHELGADLRIVHVVDENLPKELRDHTADWAAMALESERQKQAENGALAASTEVIVGDPELAIVRAAEQSGTDLLVIGVHPGARADQRGFAETTAGRVLKSCLTATLLVKDEVASSYRSVLVGVDFSKVSRAALRQAAALAPAAMIHIVHAYHVPYKGWLGTSDFIGEIAYQHQLEIDAFLASEMDDLKQRAGNYGILPGSLSTHIEEGSPLQVLRSMRERVNADLMVIGTHGRGAISRAIWGSVATDILNDPPCDVLVIRPF